VRLLLPVLVASGVTLRCQLCDLHFKFEEGRTKTAVAVESDRYFRQTDKHAERQTDKHSVQCGAFDRQLLAFISSPSLHIYTPPFFQVELELTYSLVWTCFGAIDSQNIGLSNHKPNGRTVRRTDTQTNINRAMNTNKKYSHYSGLMNDDRSNL